MGLTGRDLLRADAPFWRLMTLPEVLEFYEVALAQAADDPLAWKELRRDFCKQDLFYLLTHELNRPDVCHPWLYERCREVEANPNGYLDLWAREHFKSTIITFGLTIQDILNNPEITIGLFSHTKAIAGKFVKQIKEEFEKNANLYFLFPEILYDRPGVQAPKWTEDSITVRRRQNPKEATLEAFGLVDGMPTSAHFQLRIYDDVVTDKSVTNPEQVKKTTEQWALSGNLGKEGGDVRYIGTFYSMYDTYREILERGAAIPRIHPCVRDVEEPDFNKAAETSVLMHPDTLRTKFKEQKEYIFSCQMLLKPKKSKSMGFHEEWLRYWDAVYMTGLNIFILVDPSSGKKQDPNNKRERRDYTAMWVIGLGADERYRIIDIVRDKLSLPERQRTLERLHRDHKAKWVFYEEVGMQSDSQHFEETADRTNYDMNVITLNPKEMGGDKYDRITSLIPNFKDGYILLPRTCVKQDVDHNSVDLVRSFIREEYNPYPLVLHDDMLDALANINHPVVRSTVPVPRDVILDRAIAHQAALQRRSMDVV